MTAKITTWSHSRLTTYQQCPRKARYKFVDRIEEPKTQALQRGIDVHAGIEKYLRGEVEALPEEVTDSVQQELLSRLREKYPADEHGGAVDVEAMLAFTRDCNLCAWDDWDNCWLRVKLDCVEKTRYWLDGRIEIKIYDWKTGKYPTTEEKKAAAWDQLDLYCLAVSLWAQQNYDLKALKKMWISARMVYIDAGKWLPELATRLQYRPAEAARLKVLQSWQKKVSAMLNDSEFKPTPGYYCRWCHYRKSNGGPCENG